MSATETGRLIVGVVHEGTLYRDFAVRLPLLRDTLEAIEEVPPGSPNARISAAVAARVLTIIGAPASLVVDLDFVLNLCEIDYFQIDLAREALEKKVRSESLAQNCATTG